jgi:L-threonylcarbamoyladenylate synthase
MGRLKLISVEQGAEKLRLGKVIAYPTEAVYGLGCDPGNERAVRRILALKNRSPDGGLILIADSFDRLAGYVNPVPENRMQVARASWPGPVTWLFPRASHVPDYLAGKHATIALRVTSHPTCQALCSAFGGAIVSTSANPAAGQPAKSPEEVTRYFGDAIDGIVAGALGEQKRPSEIRDLATGAVIRAA